MQTDNPAGRLLEILKQGKEKSPHQPCKKIWGEILETSDENLPLLLSRLAKVMELPNQIIDQITLHFPNQVKSHIHWSTQVNLAFASQNLNGTWQDFIHYIDSHTIDYLSLAVDLLDMKEKTKVLSKSELEDMHIKVSELLKDVLEMELNESVKKYITRYLRKILIAIEEYHISGATPILEAVECTLGHAVIDEEYKNALSNTELGSKLLNTLNFVAAIVTLATGIPQLPTTFQLLLSSVSGS